jgi:hypothetical protein
MTAVEAIEKAIKDEREKMEANRTFLRSFEVGDARLIGIASTLSNHQYAIGVLEKVLSEIED